MIHLSYLQQEKYSFANIKKKSEGRGIMQVIKAHQVVFKLVVFSNSLELYIGVWAISFNIESSRELCHSNCSVTPAPKWGLSKAANLRRISRAKHGGGQVREVGERHVLDYHLNFLFNKIFPFFPFQVGVDYSQPRDESFLLVRFFGKALNTFDISHSLYIFISSCPLLSFVFCFAFLLYITDVQS